MMEAENNLETNINESRMLTGKIAGFSARCRNGLEAPCMRACPYGLDVREFLQKVKRGNLRAAYNILKDTLLFPETLCSICGQACRKNCALETGGEAVYLPGIEKTVLQHAPKASRRFRVPPKEEKIAVIGAGLAGVSAAYSLCSIGYSVTVFEAENTVGGSLKNLLPEEVFLPEFEFVTGMENMELVLGHPIEDRSELDGFSGVIFAAGVPTLTSVASGKQAAAAMDRHLKTGEGVREIEIPAEDVLTAVSVLVPEWTDREKAIQEAGKCRMCDCTKCVEVCELMKQYKKVPSRFEIDIPGTLNPVDQIRKRSSTRLLMSCDDCRLCEDVCPEKIKTGDVLMQVRTAMAHDKVLPAAFHDFWMRDMAFSCSPEAEYLKKPDNGYLYFPGCLLGSADPENVTGSYDLLKKYLPGVGIWLYCCGIPAKWAGETEVLRENTDRIRTVWENCGRPVFITACPSCTRNLKEMLPQIEVNSVYTLLADHADDFDKEILKGESLAVFHPCSSRFDPEEQESVRKLVIACGGELSELENAADRDGCCGYGGHIYSTNPGLYDVISARRAAADDRPYITYCANCRDVLAEKGKDCSHLLKILSEKKRTKSPASTLSERRENRKRLKAVLEGRTYEEKGMKFEIPEELVHNMDRQLILTSDVEAVIRHCEQENRYLITDDDICIGHRRLGHITYWVSWKKEGETYRVLSAYSHRMVIEGE